MAQRDNQLAIWTPPDAGRTDATTTATFSGSNTFSGLLVQCAVADFGNVWALIQSFPKKIPQTLLEKKDPNTPFFKIHEEFRRLFWKASNRGSDISEDCHTPHCTRRPLKALLH